MKEALMMLNDRNDVPDDHEENEYHFSDEDVSYEVETESSKPAPAQSNESLINRFGQSKRMLISLGVFGVLVFVVYKLLTPGSGTVATDISPAVVATNQSNTTQQMQQQVPAQMPAVSAVPQAQPMPASPEAAPAVEVAVTPPTGVEPTAQVVTTASPSQEPFTQQQPVATMPPVIAVQQPILEAPSTGAPASQQITTTTTTAPSAAQTPTDVASAQLAATNERLMAQLQSDYTQKFNDYSAQNKMLQDQMQSLSARVATMEAQLSQLVQALTPPTNQAPSPAAIPAPTSMVPPKAAISAPEIKIAYSVQAIIPGRAWLRSENGEAVTVAEGDTIKDLGRVTKIDPYDGVVEVNTGNRSVSLSYGNGNE